MTVTTIVETTVIMYIQLQLHVTDMKLINMSACILVLQYILSPAEDGLKDSYSYMIKDWH